MSECKKQLMEMTARYDFAVRTANEETAKRRELEKELSMLKEEMARLRSADEWIRQRDAMRLAEREACARVCEEYAEEYMKAFPEACSAALYCARAIRTRRGPC